MKAHRRSSPSVLKALGMLVGLAVLFSLAPNTGVAEEQKGMHSQMHGGGMMHGPMGHHSSGANERGNSQEGGEIYQRLCSSCHGASGRGDGPVGQALNPRPSDFTQHMHQHADDYFFKIIENGGASAGKSSAMPAWGGQLSEEEIWDVISYLKTLQGEH